MIKNCIICGKEFESKHGKICCNEEHFKVCSVCGNQFKLTIQNKDDTECSRACKAIARKRNLDIDPNSRSGKFTKVCKLCGKTFHTNSKSRNICYEVHEKVCPICGNTFEVKDDDKSTCGYSCASKLREQMYLEKYGVKSSLQLPEVKEKIKKTNLERYGSENPLSSQKIREQIKQTCLEKYGTEFYTQCDDMKEKSKQTCLEKFGVEHASQSDKVRDKMAKTSIERYGVDNVFKSPEFREHTKQVCLERYGDECYTRTDDFKKKQLETWHEKYGNNIDNPWASENVRRKCNETNLEKYGDIWPQRTQEIREKQSETFIMNRAKSIQDESARNAYIEFRRDPKSYLDHVLRNESTIKVPTLANKLGYSDPTSVYYICEQLGYESKSVLSVMESDIYDFIKSLDTSIEITVHDRVQLHKKELDLYIDSFKLGIECNPTYTHNANRSFRDINDSDPIPVNYHAEKTDLCESRGIFLFHIFGYEWKSRSEVIKSMIRNLLGKNKIQYYARKLDIRDVSTSEATLFLNMNHRQGAANSKVNLGLYNNDELVSLMTFSKMRNTIGRTKQDDPYTWELVRFCNKMNTTVTGGASKLFKYFINNFEFSKIVSFSDRAHTKGNLYKILGFHEVSRSDPNYVWVNLQTDLFFNRVSCQKRNLPNLFNEPDLDTENKTEKQIMLEHGFVQVYDSGNIRWEYTK